MKIIERTSLINKQGTLDVNAARQIFKDSRKFLLKLWAVLPFPTTETDGADADEILHTNPKHVKLKVFGEGTRAKSLEELHKKFEALKGKRKNYRDKLEMKGLRNRIKKKKEEKKERIRREKNLLKKQRSGPEFQPKTEAVISKPAKPIYNSEGKLVFSKFDFSESSTTTGAPQKTFSSDPKAMLKKLEKQNEVIKKLEMKGDSDKIQAAKEKFAWQKALDMAEGKKLKDNPALLAKSIRKMKSRKEKTKKKWDNIEQEKEKKIEYKQKKRTENLESRKKQNKKTKVKKSAKRGRVAIK